MNSDMVLRQFERFVLVIGWTLLLSSASTAESRDESPALQFNRDIRPILTDRCFACHGPDAETLEGGLRLDLRDEAVGEEGSAIVAGDSGASEVVRRILSDDPDEVMPPPALHKPLSADEKSKLQQWIDQGADYEMHWAYAPMARMEDAGNSSSSEASNRIDAIINQRLRQQGIQATEAADRVTLIRRLSFDLTGMPPTVEEVDAFLSDKTEQAYGNVVDRLLGSQRYGERMAVYWLDLVRYADTVGYHGDQNVSQSPYRDYVINAFNENLPYDQFILEQLAGDLLPEATLMQRVASGYNRLNQTTEEGGAQAKEYLAIYFADRVRNISQVFMGATVGCAQCHDHKYDPYTTKDFYSLGAFFADLDERGVYGARNRPPMIRVPSQELLEELQRLDARIAELESKRAPLRESLLTGQADWESEVVSTMEEKKEVETAWADDGQLIGGKPSGNWNLVSGDDVPVHNGQSSRRQESDGLIQHLFDNAKEPYQVETDARFFAWVYLDPQNPPKAIMLQLNDGDWSHRKVWGSDDIAYGRKPESYAAYFRGGQLPSTGKWVRLEVDASEVGLNEGAKVKGMAFTQFGGLVHWDKAGVIRRQGMPEEIIEALKIAPGQRNDQQSKQLADYFVSHSEEMISLDEQITKAKNHRQTRFESAPQTVISKSVKPREIRVLPRGNWMDDSGDIVQPAIPTFLGKLESESDRLSRLDLARWLCESDNPLTARTMANRIWSLMFGRGICSSVDDLGGQGTFPSYPELLDELAIEFIESGWDIKALIRTIAMSDAYQRSSVPTAELLEKDPYNDLFARQGRFCVDAEAVRDIALVTSGLLVEKIGGPSTRPYQPAGYYAQLNFPKRKYEADDDAGQYRRGLYTHWQRTFLHPMLKAFDAPSREECTAKRAKSNTPIQALVLLNDPTFVEAARVFAERIMREGGAMPEERIRWAYREAVSRDPGDRIQAELLALFESNLEAYRSDVAAAEKLTGTGIAPHASDLEPASLAAWTNIARVILNLHETITRY